MMMALVRTMAAMLLVGADGDAGICVKSQTDQAAQGAGVKGLPPPLVPRGFGVNIHFTDPTNGEMDRFADAGFRLARMDFKWDLVEKAKGVYDFTPYDRLVDHLARAGARPLFILDYGHPVHDGGQPPRTEGARRAFTQFAAAAAAHFRERGVLWEIWNEPNLAQFWRPEPDVAAYSALALETAKAIRKADPHAVILAPASSQFPWEFFEGVFRAGLLEQIDAVSVHPYRNGPPESVAADYGRLRALIARYATPERRNLPIVASEWGYSTFEGGFSEAKQAQFLTRMWLTNLACGVDLSIFYDWRDDGDNRHEPEHRCGTVRRDLSPKPSFAAAKSLIAALEGYSFRHRLEGSGTSADWQLLFQHGDTHELALVSWNASTQALETWQMPRVQRIGPADPDFPALRRLASIRYDAGARAEGGGYEASAEIVVLNPEPNPARVIAAMIGQKVESIELIPAPGQTVRRRLPLPSTRLRTESRSVPIRLSWNGQPLPAIAPLVVWRTDPLSLTAIPRGLELEVSVEDPARRAWKGRLIVSSTGTQETSTAVSLPDGAARFTVRLRCPEGWHELSLVGPDGAEVARLGRRQYEVLADFPTRPGAPSRYSSALYVENAPSPSEPVTAIDTPPGSPAKVALAYRYRFDRGWQFSEVMPDGQGTIPAGARALTVWVRGDREKDLICSRFRDATGQVFQVALGSAEGSSWRPLTIPLDGSGVSGHWGGAEDGLPHGPLAWEGLILIDSARRDAPHGGEILIAAPVYILGE